MKKFTFIAALAAVALSAQAQYQVDPSAETVLAGGKKFNIDAVILSETTIKKFQEAGCKVNTSFMINDESTHWYWWAGWDGGDSSYPGVDMHFDGYVSQVVTGTAGWSGGGLAVDSAANVSTENFTDATRFHMAVRSSNAPQSLGVIVLDGGGWGSQPAKFSVGKSAFDDNGTVFPLLAGLGEEWTGIDISFADLKKVWPSFDYKKVKVWSGNALAILSGNVAGTNFSIDAVYFYTPLEGDGIEGVDFDSAAPAEYFNLQGMRVENPSKGIFICRQGSKSSKVVLK